MYSNYGLTFNPQYLFLFLSSSFSRLFHRPSEHSQIWTSGSKPAFSYPRAIAESLIFAIDRTGRVQQLTSPVGSCASGFWKRWIMAPHWNDY